MAAETLQNTDAQISLNQEVNGDDGDIKEQQDQRVTDDMFLPEGARREIGSMVWIQRVADINLAAETFFCNFAIEFHWQCTKKEYERYCADPITYVPDYTPNFVFLNGNIEDEILTKNNGNQGYKIATTGDKGTFNETFGKELRYPIMNLCYYTYSGTFAEKFELENFPFDVQDLQITLKSLDDAKNAIFVPTLIQFKGDFSGFFVLKYSTLQEYTLHRPMLEYSVIKNFVKQPSINIRLKIERNYGMYFTNIYLMAFVVTVSTLLAFSMDPIEDLADRFGLVVTLLLTAVAFQFVLSTELPNLPYLTILDEYIIISFVFLFMVMVMIAVIPQIGDRYAYEPGDDTNTIARADRYAFYIALAICFIYHIAHAIRIIMIRRIETPKIQQDKWNALEWERKNNPLPSEPEDPKDKPIVDPKLNRINFTISESVRCAPDIWDRFEVDYNNYKDVVARNYELTEY